MNFYTILGITQNATQEEIRKVYLKMAKKYHPDKNIEGAEMFKEIGNAYKVLSCPISRRTYDLTLPIGRKSTYKPDTTPRKRHKTRRDPSPPPQSRPPPTPQPQQPPRPRTPPPPPPPPPPPLPKRSDYDIKTSTHISLSQSYTGLTQHYIKYNETIDCDTCHGQRNETKRTHTCGACLGSGSITRESIGRVYSIPCRTCNGIGTITTFLKCIQCKGKSQIERGFHIPIAKGVHSHHTLKVKLRGNLMPDKVTRGDVIIQVIVDSIENSFERRGDNLHLNLDIPLKDALLGYGSKPCFKHLDNRPVFISQKSGSVLKPGTQRIIEGEGMPVFMDGNDLRGKLYVTFQIIFPDFVNIPESIEDKKVIHDLFETEQEKKAKENAIIIDDDDEEEGKGEKGDEFNYIHIDDELL